MTDLLLQYLSPVLRYASREWCFADSAEQWCAAEANELRRGPDGPVLARPPVLTLSFLGPETYGSGESVEAVDMISHRGPDYRIAYERLRRLRPDLSDVVYARWAREDGDLWAQYWLWYFYDWMDRPVPGAHEGDWEGYAIRVVGGNPVEAVYAQHRDAERRSFTDVELADGHPVVYVARGTHASFFERGVHRTPAWFDVADGKGSWVRPRVEILPEAGWPLWPGRWGDTRGRANRPWESTAPPSPGRQKQWGKPSSWALEKAGPPVT